MVSFGNDNHEMDGYLHQRVDMPDTPMGLAERIIDRTKTMPQMHPKPYGVRRGWLWAMNVLDNIVGGMTVIQKPAFAFASVAVFALGISVFSGQISVPDSIVVNTSNIVTASNNTDISTAFFYDPDFTIEEWL